MPALCMSRYSTEAKKCVLLIFFIGPPYRRASPGAAIGGATVAYAFLAFNAASRPK